MDTKERYTRVTNYALRMLGEANATGWETRAYVLLTRHHDKHGNCHCAASVAEDVLGITRQHWCNLLQSLCTKRHFLTSKGNVQTVLTKVRRAVPGRSAEYRDNLYNDQKGLEEQPEGTPDNVPNGTPDNVPNGTQNLIPSSATEAAKRYTKKAEQYTGECTRINRERNSRDNVAGNTPLETETNQNQPQASNQSSLIEEKEDGRATSSLQVGRAHPYPTEEYPDSGKCERCAGHVFYGRDKESWTRFVVNCPRCGIYHTIKRPTVW